MEADQIVISSGSAQLYWIIKLLVYDKKFAFENPGYAYRGNGIYKWVTSRPIKVNKTGISINDLKKEDVDLVSVTPSHQFPLTSIMPISKRTALLNWDYEKNDRYIIEDDYDAEFKYKLGPISPLQVLDVNDRVIYLGNFSRIISPALRVSYMVLPKKLIRDYWDNLAHLRCSVSVFVQNALSYFIDKGYLEKQVNRTRLVYAEKFDLLHKLLEGEKI